jgi:hypothetical protein
MCPKLDITRTKPNPFKVAHSEGGFMNHAEKAENWREAGTIMPVGMHPIHLTPPHPHRLRKR